MKNSLPVNGSLWRHYNGNSYLVICITNADSEREDYPVTVVYQNIKNNTIWSRPFSRWHESMTPVFDVWSLPIDEECETHIFTTGSSKSFANKMTDLVDYFKKTISKRDNA